MTTSVVIPSFNLAWCVMDAVESALGQTVPPIEVIVVDDGSTDDTERILRAYASHPLVRVIRRKNGGLVSALNEGIRASTGEWFVPLDGDDRIASRYIELTTHVAEKQKAHAVYTDFATFGAQEAQYGTPHSFPPRDIRYENHFMSTALFQRAAWDEIGGYMEADGDWCDWGLWLALANPKWRVVGLHLPLFFYRRHPTSKSATRNQKDRAKMLETVMRNHP